MAPTTEPTIAEFVGNSRPLTAAGLSTAAQTLAVKAPEIWAVLAVETSGLGFLADRRPQILYERHIFHQLTKGQFDDGDISDKHPGGYGAGGAHQYDRLAAAMRLDREAALMSASWGLGQVMGENFAAAGFNDVETMVAAMSESEDAHLLAVVSFLKSKRLDSALHAHDWTSFARGYNGSNFTANNYDGKLRGEFQKFSFGPLPDLDIRATQLYLTFAGFHPGVVDGNMGPRTRSAIIEFQAQQGLTQSGEVDSALLARLAAVTVPPMGPPPVVTPSAS